MLGLPKLKIKNSLTSKDRNKKIKRQPTEGGRYLQSIYLTRDLHPEYMKNFFTTKKDKPIFKRAKDQNRHFFKERYTNGQKAYEKMLNNISEIKHEDIPLKTH